MRDSVINISSKQLSQDQMSVLSKGLSFVPVKKNDPFVTKVEMFKFFRSIRLKAFYAKGTVMQHNQPMAATSDGSTDAIEKTVFKPKSTFLPPMNNSSVETFCRLVERDVFSCLRTDDYSTRHRPNLTNSEKVALSTLMADDDLIIKSADKGSSIVVQDKSAYIKEIERQLGDVNSYMPLHSDPTTRFNDEIKRVLKKALSDSIVDEKTYKYLLQSNPVRPVFYTLPKIHKRLNDPPGRPIVSGNQSLTEPLSKFVDHHIKDLVQSLPSFLKDTTDFLVKLSGIGEVNETDLLCSMDVTSLYTNIPHDAGLAALEYYLQTNQVPHADFLLSLANEVLKKNYFMFQNRFFLQTQGTAMGSPMAPNYANLFMGKFEHDFIYNDNGFKQHLKGYYRFIDDLFFLWTGPKEELLAFNDYVNSRLPSIKFTLSYDDKTMPFLDVLVKKVDNAIHTEIYRKDTDRNTFLHYQSYHPPSLKRSLPHSQLLRVRRICNNDAAFEQQAGELCERFRDRGYAGALVDSCLERVRNIQRSDLLTSNSGRKSSKNTSPVTLVSTYGHISNDMKSIVQRHWHILQSDPNIGTAFQDPPRSCYKRAPSLRDKLVRSHLPASTRPSFPFSIPQGNFKCFSCAACNFMLTDKEFTHPKTGKTYTVKGRITCLSTFVVYLLTCPCGLLYVGKTKRQLKTRIFEHKSSIRRNDDKSSVARHFHSAGHDANMLKFMGLEVVNRSPRGGDRDNHLLQREAWYIFSLNTCIPNGMNEDLQLSCFL